MAATVREDGRASQPFSRATFRPAQMPLLRIGAPVVRRAMDQRTTIPRWRAAARWLPVLATGGVMAWLALKPWPSLGRVSWFPRRLADAIRRVLEEPGLAAELSVRGHDRARAFSWRDSAEKVWQLHADL